MCLLVEPANKILSLICRQEVRHPDPRGCWREHLHGGRHLAHSAHRGGDADLPQDWRIQQDHRQHQHERPGISSLGPEPSRQWCGSKSKYFVESGSCPR
jgi:hypothetical protein